MNRRRPGAEGSEPRPPRRRVLTGEERRLWALVARHVKPLSGRRLPEPSAPEAAAPLAVPVPAAPPPAEPARAIAKPSLPPLASLERRARAQLRRGTRTIDAVLDLHGMRQTEAHGALIGFLHRSQARGASLVLVVTGKGGAEVPGAFEERGVLRRVVPHWLRLPDLRPLVLGFEEAAAQHGGAGALYVRLRRAGRHG